MKSKHRTGPARRWCASLAAVALLALAAAAPAAAASKRPPPNPIYWGGQIGTQFTGEQAPWDMGAVSAFEELTRKPPSLISFASPFADCDGSTCLFNNFPTTPLENARTHGSIPFFSWNSSGGDGATQPAFRLARIIDGSYDAYIRAFAEKSREWGHPYFLRFNWEMNGFWFPWSEGVNGNKSGEFVNAWRHVHNIFVASGATNATWVWCPNVDFTRNLVPLKASTQAMTTSTGPASTASTGARPPTQPAGRTSTRSSTKPTSGAEDRSRKADGDRRGSRRGAWRLEGALDRTSLGIIPSKYRKIRGLIWYDEKDQGMHWPIESSPAATHAFAKGIARQVYMPNLFSNLNTAGPIRPLPW